MGKRNRRSSDGHTDTALVARFQEGDLSAFDGLVLRYQDKVFRTCLRFLTDYDEAVDCAQDVFVRVYGSLGGFRKDSSFSTWLYRVAVNICKNKASSLQFRRRSRMLSLDVVRDPDGTRPEVKNGRWSPQQAYERKEEEEADTRSAGRPADDGDTA